MKVLDLSFQFLYAHLSEVKDEMIEDDRHLLQMLNEVVLRVLHKEKFASQSGTLWLDTTLGESPFGSWEVRVQSWKDLHPWFHVTV